MLLNIGDPERLLTEDELEMLDHAFWGHPIPDARRKAASPTVRALLSVFVTTKHGLYSDDERQYHRRLILYGFLAALPAEFEDRLYRQIRKRGLPATLVGGSWFIRDEDLHRFFAERTAARLKKPVPIDERAHDAADRALTEGRW